MLRFENARVFIRPGFVDMRKSINGLSELVLSEMKIEPVSSGFIFVFCNKRRDRMKILYWDDTGFCLWFKRLEKHRFPWPSAVEDSQELTSDDLYSVLKGIDIFNVHEKLTFSSIN